MIVPNTTLVFYNKTFSNFGDFNCHYNNMKIRTKQLPIQQSLKNNHLISFKVN